MGNVANGPSATAVTKEATLSGPSGPLNLARRHLASQLLDSTMAPKAVVDLLWACGPYNWLGPEVPGPSAAGAFESLARQMAFEAVLDHFHADQEIPEENQRLRATQGFVCGSRLDDLGEIAMVVEQLTVSTPGASDLGRGLAINPWLADEHFDSLVAQIPEVSDELDTRRRAAHALEVPTPQSVAEAGSAHCAQALAKLWLAHASGDTVLDDDSLSMLFTVMDGATTDPLSLRSAVVGFVTAHGGEDAAGAIRCDIAERCRVIDRDLLAWTRTSHDDLHAALVRAVLDGRNDATFSEAAGLWALAHTEPEIAERSYDAAGTLWRWRTARERLDAKLVAGRKERWQRNVDRIAMAELLGQSSTQSAVLALSEEDGMDPAELCRLVASCPPDVFVQVIRGHMRFRPAPGEIAEIFAAMPTDTQDGVTGLLGFLLIQGLELGELAWAGDLALAVPQVAAAVRGRLAGYVVAHEVEQSLGDDPVAWGDLLDHYEQYAWMAFQEFLEQVASAHSA